MTSTLRSVKGSCLLLAVALSACAPATSHGAVPDVESRRATVRACQIVSEIDGRLRQADPATRPALAAKAIDELERAVGPGHSGAASGLVWYLRARLAELAGRPAETADMLHRCVLEDGLVAEAVWGLVEIARDPAAMRRWLPAAGEIQPLSFWAGLMDAQASAILGDGGGQVIPAPEARAMLQAAEALAQAGLYEWAAVAYRELLYATAAPPLLTDPYGRATKNWLSAWSAPVWLKIADLEWRLGRPESAVMSAAKAAAFGGEADRRRAAVFIERTVATAPPATRPAPQAEQIIEAAHAYARMNMHPRAIALLAEQAEVVGPAGAALREELSAEWRGLMKRFTAGKPKTVLFGQDVTDPATWDRITIPPPLRPEAIRAAREKIVAKDSDSPTTAPAQN